MRARVYIGWCVGLLMLGLLYVLASQLGEDPRTIPSAQIGQRVSKRALPILDRAHWQSVQQALKGQAGFVHFWATWCMTCQAEQPELMAHVRSVNIPWVGVVFKDNPRACAAVVKAFRQSLPSGFVRFKRGIGHGHGGLWHARNIFDRCTRSHHLKAYRFDH